MKGAFQMLKKPINYVKLLLVIALCFSGFCWNFVIEAQAAQQEIRVTVDGRRINFSGQQPIIIDGRTLVPVRGVFEELGFLVSWDAATQTATLSDANNHVTISIGNRTFTANGTVHNLEVPAQIINGSTMLPIRAVVESVGYQVNWNSGNSTVLITTGIPQPVPQQNQPAANNTRIVMAGGITAFDLDAENILRSTSDGVSYFAIDAAGNLWGWGSNRYGQLGDGTLTRRLAPIKIMENVTYVAAAGTYTMAITTDGTLWGWGHNIHGNLGDGTYNPLLYGIPRAGLRPEDSQLTPLRIMDNVASVSIGSITVAVTTDGGLWAWGNNDFGRVGDGTTINRHTPVRIMDNVVAAHAGSGVTLAIRTDGSLWGWGDNRWGALADGNFIPVDFLELPHERRHANQHTPIRIKENVASIVRGQTDHVAVITRDNALWEWGGGFEPSMLMENVASVDISSTNTPSSATFVITTDGVLWAWGDNLHGQLGDGTSVDRRWVYDGAGNYSLTPARVLENVVAVSASDSHTAAITADGALWTWGSNSGGQLGNGDGGAGVRVYTPTRVLENVIYVSTLREHTTAITADGGIWAWGSNFHGDFGQDLIIMTPRRIAEIQVPAGGLGQPASPPAGTVPQHTDPVQPPNEVVPSQLTIPNRTLTDAEITQWINHYNELGGANEFELEVIRLVNIERVRVELYPLVAEPTLMMAARFKSQSMHDLNYIGHSHPAYGLFPGVLERVFGFDTTRAIGENLARGQQTPEAVVARWMDSPDHRENIMRPAFTRIGVGFYENSWTQKFSG